MPTPHQPVGNRLHVMMNFLDGMQQGSQRCMAFAMAAAVRAGTVNDLFGSEQIKSLNREAGTHDEPLTGCRSDAWKRTDVSRSSDWVERPEAVAPHDLELINRAPGRHRRDQITLTQTAF